MRELSLLREAAEQLVEHRRIEALLVAWAERVDRHAGAGVEELFAEDGVFATGDRRAVGRDAIRATYERRRARGPRTARHLLLNLGVTFEADTEATARSVMVLYADDGRPPLPVSLPLLVQDVEDRCVRDGAGHWRFASRLMTPIFTDGRAVALPLPDPTHDSSRDGSRT
jgi:hypothetical protein